MTLATPKRWTRETYYRMAEQGLLEGKVELVNGIILEMSPQSPLHSLVIGRLNRLLVKAYGDAHMVRVQCPLNLGEWDQPEPDFAVVALNDLPDDEHPARAVLVVEVSASSLEFDRGDKRALYQKSEVDEYWVVNLKVRQLEIYQGSNCEVLKPGAQVTLPGCHEVIQIDDILGA